MKVNNHFQILGTEYKCRSAFRIRKWKMFDCLTSRVIISIRTGIPVVITKLEKSANWLRREAINCTKVVTERMFRLPALFKRKIHYPTSSSYQFWCLLCLWRARTGSCRPHREEVEAVRRRGVSTAQLAGSAASNDVVTAAGGVRLGTNGLASSRWRPADQVHIRVPAKGFFFFSPNYTILYLLKTVGSMILDWTHVFVVVSRFWSIFSWMGAKRRKPFRRLANGVCAPQLRSSDLFLFDGTPWSYHLLFDHNPAS